MTTPGGKLLNAKDSATLSCASKEERERLVAGIVREMHKKRRHAVMERNRASAEIASAPDIQEQLTCS